MPSGPRGYEPSGQAGLCDRGSNGLRAHYRRRLIVIVLALATPLLGFALLLFMQRLEERMMSAPAQVSAAARD